MNAKKILIYTISLFVIPLIIVLGTVLFGSKAFSWLILITALLSCVPFLLCFEGEKNTRKVVLLAVMVALSVAGRFVFAPIQFFKPVAAIVILSGMYFGAEFGFLTGALSAVVSDFYFGQGPWTPFQMFSWGLIGLLAGLLSDPLKRSKLTLVLYGAFSGILFSLIMDVWTTLSIDGGEFNPARFLTAVSSSLPIIGIYAVSNVLFLLVLSPLFKSKIERIKTKYGI